MPNTTDQLASLAQQGVGSTRAEPATHADPVSSRVVPSGADSEHFSPRWRLIEAVKLLDSISEWAERGDRLPDKVVATLDRARGYVAVTVHDVPALASLEQPEVCIHCRRVPPQICAVCAADKIQRILAYLEHRQCGFLAPEEAATLAEIADHIRRMV